MKKYYNDYKSVTLNDNEVLFDVFDAGSGKKTITIPPEKELTYIGVCKDTCDVNLEFKTLGAGSVFTITILCLCTQENNVKLHLEAQLAHDKCSANVHIVSLYADNAKATVEGSIVMKPGVQKLAGELLEENIILGDEIQLKTLPMLDVQTNDVTASHGARIQRLDAEKMFYMQSKGLNEDGAKKLMIEGMIETMLAPIKEEQREFLKNDYLSYILKNA